MNIQSDFTKLVMTFNDHGFRVTFFRILKYLVVLIRYFFTRKKWRHGWEDLKGRYIGGRVFLLGNGPSLNSTPLFLLEDEDTFCVNGINLLFARINWRPTYYAVTDDLVVQDLKDVIPNIVSETRLSFFPWIHPSNISFSKFISAAPNIRWFAPISTSFQTNLPRLAIGNTVINACIQIAIWLGYKEIFILGVDLSYAPANYKKETKRNWVSTGDDHDHFDKRYFGDGKRFHDPQPNRMHESFDRMAEFARVNDVSIVNVGVGGALSSFPRAGLQQVLGLSDADVISRFLRTIEGVVTELDFREFMDGTDRLSVLDSGAVLSRHFITTDPHDPTLQVSCVGPCLGVYVSTQ